MLEGTIINNGSCEGLEFDATWLRLDRCPYCMLVASKLSASQCVESVHSAPGSMQMPDSEVTTALTTALSTISTKEHKIDIAMRRWQSITRLQL